MSGELGWAGRLELKVDGHMLLDEEGFQILRAIHEKGSIAFAAQSVGRSYAYVWRYIDGASKALGNKLAETSIGGRTHGSTTLTSYARNLLEEYNTLTRLQRNAITAHRKKLKGIGLTVTGSDCPALSLLLEMLRDEAGIVSEMKAVGSAAGLATMMLAEADIAGLHLLDEATDQYNIPFLKRFWIEDKVQLVRGYVREQGLIVKRGNPHKITKLDDLTRKDVKIVNRQRGSGTRILLDHLLSKLAEKRSVSVSRLTRGVRGYENEVRSHSGVMEQILASKADVGLGIRPTGNYLDFIPIHKELFDFAIDKDKINRPVVQAFTHLLSSKKFKDALGLRRPGIHTIPDSGRIAYP